MYVKKEEVQSKEVQNLDTVKKYILSNFVRIKDVCDFSVSAVH